MMTKLRVAVVGVGYLGRFHALIYSRLPEVELVGVVDTTPARAQAVAAEVGCAVLTLADITPERVDAASIVVPTATHFAVAAPLLERGIHLLLEKPIAETAADAQALVTLAAQHTALLQIGHLERFNAGVMALAERIQAPRFIEAQRLGSFVERATDVDVVTDLMIHDIDIILTLVPSELLRVQAIGATVLTEHVDIANARLEFANGTVANVVASRVSEKTSRRIRVFQPGAYLALDFAAQTLDVAFTQPQPDAARPTIERQRVDCAPIKPLDAEIAAFVHAVRLKQPPLVDGMAGLRALEVALQVRAAMASRL